MTAGFHYRCNYFTGSGAILRSNVSMPVHVGGSASLRRCHRITRPPDNASGRTAGPRILRPPDSQSLEPLAVPLDIVS